MGLKECWILQNGLLYVELDDYSKYEFSLRKWHRDFHFTKTTQDWGNGPHETLWNTKSWIKRIQVTSETLWFYPMNHCETLWNTVWEGRFEVTTSSSFPLIIPSGSPLSLRRCHSDQGPSVWMSEKVKKIWPCSWDRGHQWCSWCFNHFVIYSMNMWKFNRFLSSYHILVFGDITLWFLVFSSSFAW